jgi:hypothetical protein
VSVLPRQFEFDQLGAVVVDLQRGVVEREPFAQQRLEPAPRGVAVGVRIDEDVRRQRGEVRADLPHVQVVNATMSAAMPSARANRW